jgi:hypothetical protein
MAENIDEITINYEEDGVLVVKELEKEILTRGAWTTIIFRYQQWEPAKEVYSADHYTIRRYRKVKGSYSQQSKFNITNREQGAKLAEILARWTKE